MKGWRDTISSSNEDGFINYLLVGARGLQPGDATERYATIYVGFPPQDLYTSLSHLLYAK
jgi:hypothetical protein